MSGARDAAAVVVEQLLKQLEAGIVPWRKPWQAGESANLVSRVPYTGINALILGAAEMLNGYSAPYWCTFKQALELGGHVNRGEKGTQIIFYREYERENEDGETEARRVLRFYTVFNAAQCSGLKLPEVKAVPRVESVDTALAPYLGTLRGGLIRGGARAGYSVQGDSIVLPVDSAFESTRAMYSTLLHEVVHSTGADHRLARDLKHWSADLESYSREELIAEIGAGILCMRFGLEPDFANSAAYVESWAQALGGMAPREVISAASAAGKAADFVMSAACPAADLPVAAAA